VRHGERWHLGFPIGPTLPILNLTNRLDVLDAPQEVTVPLSEHEQRLLEQMERALYAEDPKFATSMRSNRAAAGDRRRLALGVVGFILGMGLLVTGVATQLVVVGVLGFLAMVGGLWLAVASMRTTRQGGGQAGPVRGGPTGPRPSRSPRVRRGESLTERMEQRWRRRRETGDF
jgi:hypothetical protein